MTAADLTRLNYALLSESKGMSLDTEVKFITSIIIHTGRLLKQWLYQDLIFKTAGGQEDIVNMLFSGLDSSIADAIMYFCVKTYMNETVLASKSRITMCILILLF